MKGFIKESVQRVMMLFIAFAGFSESFEASGQNRLYAFHGILDARSRDFSDKIALNGYWNFYPMRLLTPEECRQTNRSEAGYFPQFWNETSDTGIGFATYSLIVLVPPSIDSFSIQLPSMYCSYELWCNGLKVAVNGRVGTSQKTTVPQWLPQVTTVAAAGDTLFLVLHLANFHHHRGGSKDPIYLGLPEKILPPYSVALISSTINAILIALIGVGFIILFFLKQRQQVILYFALLCITWSVRSLFSNLYSFITVYPDFNWLVAVKIEYGTLHLLNIFAILFLHHLFSYAGNQGIRYFLVLANVVFVAITVLSPPVFFTRWLSVYLFFSGATLVYGTVIIIRATIHEQLEAWLLVMGLLMGIVTFSYELISYQGVLPYSPIVLNIGYLLIFILVGLALLLRLGTIRGYKPRTILTYKDLFDEEKS